MPLAIAGSVLMLLGILCGVALLALPFGLFGLKGGLSLWLLFPLFSVGGFVLLGMGGRLDSVRTVSRGAALVLLALALGAALALVASAVGLAAESAGVVSLWYVLVVAGVMGSIGAAAFRSRSGAADTGA